MTPVEQGRFCGACQKKVVDFSGMTDKQILEVWKQNRYAMPCGRYKASQLNRVITPPPKPGLVAGIIKRAAALALLFETASAAHAQQQHTPHTVTVPQERDMKYVDGMSDVTGLLLEPATNKPVTGQQLYIAATAATVITDSNGRFNFTISDSITSVKIKVNPQGAPGAEYDALIITDTEGRRSTTVHLTPVFALPLNPLIGEITVQGAMPYWPNRDIPIITVPKWSAYITYVQKAIRLPFSVKPKPGKSVMARLSNYWSGNKQQ